MDIAYASMPLQGQSSLVRWFLKVVVYEKKGKAYLHKEVYIEYREHKAPF